MRVRSERIRQTIGRCFDARVCLQRVIWNNSSKGSQAVSADVGADGLKSDFAVSSVEQFKYR